MAMHLQPNWSTVSQSLHIIAWHATVDCNFCAIASLRLPEIGEKEASIGILVAALSKEAGAQIFIYSSLPNVEKLSNGKYVSSWADQQALLSQHLLWGEGSATSITVHACLIDTALQDCPCI